MSNCNEYAELVALACDDLLTEAEQQRLNEHLEACPDCRALTKEYKRISDIISEQESPPDTLTPGIMYKLTLPREKKGLRRFLPRGVALVAASVAIAFIFMDSRGMLEKNNPSADASLRDFVIDSDISDDSGSSEVEDLPLLVDLESPNSTNETAGAAASTAPASTDSMGQISGSDSSKNLPLNAVDITKDIVNFKTIGPVPPEFTEYKSEITDNSVAVFVPMQILIDYAAANVGEVIYDIVIEDADLPEDYGVIMFENKN